MPRCSYRLSRSRHISSGTRCVFVLYSTMITLTLGRPGSSLIGNIPSIGCAAMRPYIRLAGRRDSTLVIVPEQFTMSFSRSQESFARLPRRLHKKVHKPDAFLDGQDKHSLFIGCLINLFFLRTFLIHCLWLLSEDFVMPVCSVSYWRISFSIPLVNFLHSSAISPIADEYATERANNQGNHH